jgi:hypothetical protein
MTAASQAASVHPLDLDTREQQQARHRFAAIVRALAKVAGVARPPAAPPAAVPNADLPDEPTRRVNRLRRLFGRLGKRPLQGGKSRQKTR